MLEQNTLQPKWTPPRCAGDKREAATFPQHFAEELIEFFVVGQERKDFSRGTRDEERRPAVAIRVTENGNVAPERQAHTGADFFPHIRGSDRSLRKNGATGIGFGLKAEHPPNVTPRRA